MQAVYGCRIDQGEQVDFSIFQGVVGVRLRPMTWAELAAALADGSEEAMGTLGRLPLDIKRYYDYRDQVLQLCLCLCLCLCFHLAPCLDQLHLEHCGFKLWLLVVALGNPQAVCLCGRLLASEGVWRGDRRSCRLVVILQFHSVYALLIGPPGFLPAPGILCWPSRLVSSARAAP